MDRETINRQVGGKAGMKRFDKAFKVQAVKIVNEGGKKPQRSPILWEFTPMYPTTGKGNMPKTAALAA